MIESILGLGGLAASKEATQKFERKTAFRVYQTGSQNFAFASPASPVDFSHVSYDAGNNFSLSTNKLTVPLRGIWNLNSTVTIRQEANGDINVALWLMREDGVFDTPIASGTQGFFRGRQNGDILGLTLGVSILLERSDEVYLQVQITNGGVPMTIQGAGLDYWTWFSGYRQSDESRTRLQ